MVHTRLQKGKRSTLIQFRQATRSKQISDVSFMTDFLPVMYEMFNVDGLQDLCSLMVWYRYGFIAPTSIESLQGVLDKHKSLHENGLLVGYNGESVNTDNFYHYVQFACVMGKYLSKQQSVEFGRINYYSVSETRDWLINRTDSSIKINDKTIDRMLAIDANYLSYQHVAKLQVDYLSLSSYNIIKTNFKDYFVRLQKLDLGCIDAELIPYSVLFANNLKELTLNDGDVIRGFGDNINRLNKPKVDKITIGSTTQSFVPY